MKKSLSLLLLLASGAYGQSRKISSFTAPTGTLDTVRATTFTDKAGTGRPTFSFGVNAPSVTSYFGTVRADYFTNTSGTGPAYFPYGSSDNKVFVAVDETTNINPANNAVISITSAAAFALRGGGAAKTGITLSTSGAVQGQIVYLIGDSWGVTVVNGSTADLAGGSLTLGNSTGQHSGATLMYVGTTWREISRSKVR